MASLFELSEDLSDVALVGESDHDVQFLQLDVDWVVVLHKEHLHLRLQNVRSANTRP